MILAGYASLFGVADLEGDVVRAGAFASSLARLGGVAPMLLEHHPKAAAGRWRAHEDARGLYVEGAIDPRAPAAARARLKLAAGLDGLSIGYRALAAEPRAGGGRTLIEIELLEVSLVALPMQPLARLSARATPQPALQGR